MNKTIEYAITLLNETYPHILEFGVFQGNTLTQIRKSTSNDYSIFGFDSFYGLPEDWEHTNIKKGGFNMNGIIPEKLKKLNNTKIIPGWFSDTIPNYLKIADNISLLHIDSDLYSSAKDILYSDIKKYIKKDTIIVFDEWYYNFEDKLINRQHEQKLFFEWVDDFNVEYELLPVIEEERQIIKIIDIKC